MVLIAMWKMGTLERFTMHRNIVWPSYKEPKARLNTQLVET